MSTKLNVKDFRDEPACAHNTQKASPCSAPKPGATSGGCAFEGAQISLFPYADAAHLVHGPITCLGASWETRATRTSWSGEDFTQMGFTTDVNLNDVIFSGEEKLQHAIEKIMTDYAPEAVFVYSTCVTALIGDDIDQICKEAQETYAIPVVPVHAPGFVGEKSGQPLGGRNGAASSGWNQGAGICHPVRYQSCRGIQCNRRYVAIYPLLEELGVRVLATLSGDGRIEAIRAAHRAQLNVIVCAKSLVSFTRRMEEQYGIPWISLSFYGKRDTSAGLLSIAEALGDTDLIKRTGALIRREEARVEESLRPYRKIFAGKKAILNTGGNKSWSIAAALQDLGIEVVATSVRKATAADKEKAESYLGTGGVLMQNPGTEQAALIEEKGAHLLLAGGRSLYTALKKQIAFIDVNQEKKRSYGAYAGLLNLAEDIKNALENPVFTLAGRRSPWEK